MSWLFVPILIVLAVAAYAAGLARARRRLTQARQAGEAVAARPGQHAGVVLIWAVVPALVVALMATVFVGPVKQTLTAAGSPEVVQQLEPLRRQAFLADARRVGDGQQPLQIWEPQLVDVMAAEGRRLHGIDLQLSLGSLALALSLGLLGGLVALSRIRPGLRARTQVEAWVIGLLFASSVVAVLTTVGIAASLIIDSLKFFAKVPATEFLFGTHWSPQEAIRADQVGSTGGFGAVPLFVGTLLIMVIAMCVAAPIGLFSAIYLSEYAGPVTRGVVKPVLEVLAGVPTVVYGFFAALTVGPAMRGFFNGLGGLMVGGPLDGIGQYLMLVQNQMALVAGAVMGIMLIPFVSSLSDDILNAVPQTLRDGSYAMGATKSETVTKVLLPAALPGVAGAMLLAVSRAIGETMIVTMAAGLAARLSVNPLDTVTTVTVQIVTLLTGDQAFDSAKTLSAFALGLTLFLMTLVLNIIAQRIVQTYRQQYD